MDSLHIYREGVTAKALLLALAVLVLAQIGLTAVFSYMAYSWTGGQISWILVGLSCIYAFKYALVSAATAFVVALGGFAFAEALRRRKRHESI